MEHQDLLEKCILAAKNAGVPRDQVEALVSKGYVPSPWQWEFHAAAREADKADGPVEIAAGGARGPGKSHATFAQVALDDCQRVAGLKVLFLRKTAVSAKESFDDLINKVILGRLEFTRTVNTIVFANGSRIILGGFHNEKDIDKYIGIEYDIIVVEELNQLTEEKLEKLLGSLRTSKPGWRPRLYCSFNPGGIGHAFVKARYVTPRRLQEERKTRFIPSTYRSNPFLNKEYIEYLEGLQGDLGRAWREGDFDLFAGQFFQEWRHDIHVVDPFSIPDDWRRAISGDAGYKQPSVGWWAISPEGQCFRYRELYKGDLTASQLAEETVALTGPNEVISYEVWDPAFWAKKGDRDDALSGAEVYMNRKKELTGVTPHMIRGENSRIQGWMVFREFLRPYQVKDAAGIERVTAKLQVLSTCTDFIRTVPTLQHDEHNPEDLDTEGEDHPADDSRYFFMSRPKPAATAAQIEDRRFAEKMKQKRMQSTIGRVYGPQKPKQVGKTGPSKGLFV